MDGHYAGNASYQSKCQTAGMSLKKCEGVYPELTYISLQVSHFNKKEKTYIHQYPLAELLPKAESNIFVSPHTANRLNEASIGTSLSFCSSCQARILAWVAFPFSRGSPQPRDRARVSHTAGGCLPAEPQGACCLSI